MSATDLPPLGSPCPPSASAFLSPSEIDPSPRFTINLGGKPRGRPGNPEDPTPVGVFLAGLHQLENSWPAAVVAKCPEGRI